MKSYRTLIGNVGEIRELLSNFSDETPLMLGFVGCNCESGLFKQLDEVEVVMNRLYDCNGLVEHVLLCTEGFVELNKLDKFIENEQVII